MWRINVIAAFFLLLFGGLVFRLYGLQVKHGTYYLTRAESQAAAQTYDELNRGSIYFTDKYGNLVPAAMNKDYPTIFAVPIEMQKSGDINEYAAQLHEIFPDIPIAELQSKFSNAKSMYYLLAKKASDEQVSRVKQAGIKGVYVEYRKMRFYPFGALAAHVLGYLGQDASARPRGYYGTESYFNDGLGNNTSLQLTIDYNIQAEAEKTLNRLIGKFGAKGGTIIVEDPKTGSILAMGSEPSFDPNDYSSYPVSDFLNPAVQEIYEPGSVFKVFTMASGIDSGAITPETRYTDTGSVIIDGRTIKNWDLKAHGVQTMTGVIEQSLNTGAVFAEQKTGSAAFLAYMKKFGLGDRTGITLPGELQGDLRRLSGNQDIYFATASFGQGVAVTPLALINAMSAIANKGVRMKPNIIAGTAPEEADRVMSASSARAVTGMMVSAVDKAQVGKIEGYSVAGKSGTAFIPDFKFGGYTDRVINTYAGFAPAYDARAVVLIKLDDPKGAPLAGETVVPAFRDLLQFILNYYRVSPDRTR